jgi:hypothetical protein
MDRLKSVVALAGICGLLFFAGWHWLLRDPGVSGKVVDAVTGRVPSGVTLMLGTQVLRRFQTTGFRFPDVGDGGELRLTAPGYSPVQVGATAGERNLHIAMQPRYVPGLSGIVVFPKQKGTEMQLTLQLLDETGRTMSEFPGVKFATRLNVLDREGKILGGTDLRQHFDYAGQEIAATLIPDSDGIAQLAARGGVSLSVSLSADGKTFTTRSLPLPPALIAHQ